MADFQTILNPLNTSLTLYCDNAIIDGTNVLNELATLQTEIDSLTPNPNAWNNGNGQTTTNQQILFTDNSINGAITSDKLYFDTATNLIYLNDEIMPVRSEIDTINTNITIIAGQIGTLQGDTQTNTEQITNLTNRVNDLEALTSTQQTDIINLQTNVSTNTSDIATNTSNISTNTSNITQLQTQTTSLETYANTAMLRAINCNNWTPTTVYNIVWSNLTEQEKLEWKGLDNTTIDPVQSASGNYWNFSKSLVNSNKIGWYIPVDLSGLTFQDLESFWCVIRFNNTTSITTEGSIYFSFYTNPPTPPNYYRTRINYSNPATAMNQTGYFYKIYALDTITTTTTANFGRAQEVGQTKYKLNPMNVRSDLWSIPFNKVLAPAGDVSQGYTNAPIQSISLHTNSSSTNLNFDVVSIGYLDKQYNLFYS